MYKVMNHVSIEMIFRHLKKEKMLVPGIVCIGNSHFFLIPPPPCVGP